MTPSKTMTIDKLTDPTCSTNSFVSQPKTNDSDNSIVGPVTDPMKQPNSTENTSEHKTDARTNHKPKSNYCAMVDSRILTLTTLGSVSSQPSAAKATASRMYERVIMV